MEIASQGTEANMSNLLERVTDLETELYRASKDPTASRMHPAIVPIANPSPLGLMGFAIVSWLSGLLKISSNFSARTDGLFAATAFFIGGTAQLVAGFIQVAKNETHSATTFCLYGLHWLSQGFIIAVNSIREVSLPPQQSTSIAAYFALLAFATFLLWIPTFRMNWVLNVTLAIVFFVFLLDSIAAGGWRGVEIAAGVASCTAATIAFYMALLDLVNEAWRRPLFPLFPHQDHKRDYNDSMGAPYVPRITFHKSSTSSPHL